MNKAKHVLAVKERKEFGKNASRRARKAGQIPAAVYGKGKENMTCFVDVTEWQVLSAHDVHMVTLDTGARQIPALVKEVQFNYLKNSFVHIDFQEVSLTDDVHTAVPIHVAGTAVGVNRGGILEQELHNLEIVCHADSIPENLTVDVSALELGGTLLVKDLTLPAGVRANVSADAIVFHVVRPKVEAEPAEAAATEPVAIKEKKDKE